MRALGVAGVQCVRFERQPSRYVLGRQQIAPLLSADVVNFAEQVRRVVEVLLGAAVQIFDVPNMYA